MDDFKDWDAVNIQLSQSTHEMWSEKSSRAGSTSVSPPFNTAHFLNTLEDVESLSGVEPAQKQHKNTRLILSFNLQESAKSHAL